MKKISFLFCLFFALISFSQKQIPNITISDFEGSNEKVHNLLTDDKLTVISLWATWCVPCIKELDAINDIYDDWKEEINFDFFAISVDDSRSQKRAKALANGKSWPYQIFFDKIETLPPITDGTTEFKKIDSLIFFKFSSSA